MTQLVREGMEHVLAADRRASAWERFLAAAGSCRAEDDPVDVSSRHDAYLSDAFEFYDDFSRQGFETVPGRPS